LNLHANMPYTHSTKPCIDSKEPYRVATISRLLQMIGLFRKRALYKRLYSAKETNYFEGAY